MIVINLKNYKTGNEVLELVRKIEIYYNNSIVAVPAVEIEHVVKNTSLQIIAQHVDYHEIGRGTGKITPESLKAVGVGASLLNHSEFKLKPIEIKKTIKRCDEVSLKIILCVGTLKEAKDYMKYKPYAMAFEDKKLIATGKSVTSHKTHYIKEFVELLKGSEIIPLCGAGINSGEDVASALVLGCKGVLVSSAVAHEQNPEIFLKEMGGLF